MSSYTTLRLDKHRPFFELFQSDWEAIKDLVSEGRTSPFNYPFLMSHHNYDGNRKEEDEIVINPFAGYQTSMRNRRSPTHSLESVSTFHSVDAFAPRHHLASEYLEFEASSHEEYSVQTMPHDDDQDDADDLLGVGLEGLSTTSGLLLAHRQSRGRSINARPSGDRIPTNRVTKRLEMDWEFSSYRRGGGDPSLQRARRMLSVTQVWIAVCCIIFVIGTGCAWHSSHTEAKPASVVQESELLSSSKTSSTVDQIILVPLPSSNASTILLQPRKLAPARGVVKPQKGALRRALRELRQEFDDWVETHGKKYHSHDEKERRFDIWKDNHFRTQEKNDRHGPCKLTKTPVFGSNLFKDLSPEEFQSRYLTGYKGPRTDQIHHPLGGIRQANVAPVLDPKDGPIHAIPRHPAVQEEHLNRRLAFSASYGGTCTWYDVSCWLKLFVRKYGYRIGGTMEPSYDAKAYPSAVDWRDLGVVTSVHSQGSCGACWAITAVETIESAYAMYTGNLYDLAEAELIICDNTCDLCEGGWPQNAYEYAMKHKGLPLEKTMSYNGDYLLELTYAKTGASSSYNYETVMQKTCPSGDQQGSSRYGNIAGYGYTTDRCICYTDGTGCDCDKQNEKLALQNVATYGPATVCLEASLWQDYTGGIITSDLGCTSAFLDMNHCVQVVGYAFTDGKSDNGNEDEKKSGSRDGSKDSGTREGYWIVRNQWSENWGMYGYAYVAMGANTCGVLNDMTNVYMKKD